MESHITLTADSKTTLVLRYSGCPHRSQAVPLHTLIPAFRTHRNEDLCELEASLLYVGTSRSAKVTRKTVFKKKGMGAVRRKNSNSSRRRAQQEIPAAHSTALGCSRWREQEAIGNPLLLHLSGLVSVWRVAWALPRYDWH